MIQLTINGSPQQLEIDPDTPLLWAIRSCVAGLRHLPLKLSA